MTEERTDSIQNSDYRCFILTASFKFLSLFISEKMTDQCLKLLLQYLQYLKPGRNFSKIFLVTLVENISVSERKCILSKKKTHTKLYRKVHFSKGKLKIQN